MTPALLDEPVTGMAPFVDALEGTIPQQLPEPTVTKSDAGQFTAGYEPEDPLEVHQLEVSPLFPTSRVAAPPHRFRLLQHWECVVTEVTDSSVWADIYDLTDSSQPEEVVELPLDEFNPDDRHLLKDGAVFYWAIGYDLSPGGQVSRVSRIRLRRTPRWTGHAIKKLNRSAQEMLEQMAAYERLNTSDT